jgi:lysophospholipase L1-like esterase
MSRGLGRNQMLSLLNAAILVLGVAAWLTVGSAPASGAGQQATPTAAIPASKPQAVLGAASYAPLAAAGPDLKALPSWRLGWRAEEGYPKSTDTTQSCRFAARMTASGELVRAEFTAPAGGRGYTILDASIARSRWGGLDVIGTTATPLRFAGRPEARVEAGQRLLSDPVAVPSRDGVIFDVTLTVSAGDTTQSGHVPSAGGCSAGALSDAAHAPAGAFSRAQTPWWLNSLLVDGPDQRSIAAFGDSITAGPTEYRWSDVLTGHGAAVVNAGVGGTGLTRVGFFHGASGAARAQALLVEPGLTDLVVLIGTNDLSWGVAPADFLTALDSVAKEAANRHVQVWVCTLPPRGGSAGWSPSMESARQAVNAALRGQWLATDGVRVIDTEPTVADPLDPQQLNPLYDAGDHLHPNAAGALQIGAAVGKALGLFS